MPRLSSCLIATAGICEMASKTFPFVKLLLVIPVVFVALAVATASAVDVRGNQFIGFKAFSSFKTSAGETPAETVLTSPEIIARNKCDEIIESWDDEKREG